jgi:hypothetical protein
MAGLRKTTGPPPRPPLIQQLTGPEVLAPRVPYMVAHEEASAAGLSGVVDRTSSGTASDTVMVLIVQKNSLDAEELDALLTDAVESSGRKVDLVVLPEGAHHEAGAPTIKDNELLRELAAVVASHECWAVLGTMMETERSGGTEERCYCTAIVVNRQGEVAHTYRKRAIPSDTGLLTAGDSVGVFETDFGRVGVMICFDSESDALVEELLAEEPVLVINPIHIGAGPVPRRGAAGGAASSSVQWRVACESMSRRIDHLVSNSASCCGWVRCDQPYPIGLGSSMLVSRYETQHVPTMTDAVWPVEVSINPSRVLVAPPPPRPRTDKWDNCGSRYTRRSALLPMKPGGVAPVCCAFSAEGVGAQGDLHVWFSDGSVSVLDLAQSQARDGDITQVGAPPPSPPAESAAAATQSALLARAALCSTDLGDVSEVFPIPLEEDVVEEEGAGVGEGFFLAASIVVGATVTASESGPGRTTRGGERLLTLCRWQQPAASDGGSCVVDAHHSFSAGPLGASAFSYDVRRGRIAIVSAEPLRNKAQLRSRPVASSVARHRFVVGVITLAQHRMPVTLGELLL